MLQNNGHEQRSRQCHKYSTYPPSDNWDKDLIGWIREPDSPGRNLQVTQTLDRAVRALNLN